MLRSRNCDVEEEVKASLASHMNMCKKVGEKLLFHGTQERLIDPIINQGFDWRLAGQSVDERLIREISLNFCLLGLFLFLSKV